MINRGSPGPHAKKGAVKLIVEVKTSNWSGPPGITQVKTIRRPPGNSREKLCDEVDPEGNIFQNLLCRC